MTKKNQNMLIIGALVVAFLLFSGNAPQTLGGFSTISVSSVSINSLQQILFTASIDGGGEAGEVDLNPSLTSVLEGRAGRVKLTVEMQDQSCGYSIDNFGEIVYAADLQTQRFSSCNVNGQNTCTSAGYQLSSCSSRDPITNIQIDNNANLYNSCYTYGQTPRYQKGHINSVPNIGWKIKITLTPEIGTPIIKYIDPQNLEADLGQDVGKVKWIGNFQTNIACGSPTNRVILRGLQETRWKEIPLSPYFNDYQNAWNNYQSQTSSILGGWNAGQTANQKLSAAGAQLTGDYGNQILITPTQNVVNPVLQFQLNANYFGLQIPREAKAKVEKIVVDPIFDNVQTQMKIDVRNIGTQSDGFDVALTCDKQISFSAQRVTIAPDQVVTVTANVQGFAGDYSCTAKATPVNAPNNFGVLSFGLTIFKPMCPATFACCQGSPAYNDRACGDTSKLITGTNLIHDGSGAITGYEYYSYVQIQHYTCGGFACTASTTEEQAGSRQSIITTLPTVTPYPSVSVQPSALPPTPTPTIQPTVIGSPTPFPTYQPPTGGGFGGLDNFQIILIVVIVGFGLLFFLKK